MPIPAADLAQHIRTVADWPLPGVQFRDITPLLRNGAAFRALIDIFADRYGSERLDAIAGIDARGFILGAALAHHLGVGFVPVRKQGKLPFDTVAESYTLEYGQATVEVHTDAASPGERVLVIDDLVATGGTMIAAARLMQRLGAHLVETAAVIDLPALGGSQRIADARLPFFSVLTY
jgi:adenine phosphoribosyltransferase